MTTQQYIRGRWSRFGPTDGFDEDVVLNPMWTEGDLAPAVRQGLVGHGASTPAITAAHQDGSLFVTPHTIWELTPASAAQTNTVTLTFTPVAFGASLPNEIGVHRAIGTLPAAGVFPSGLPAGIVGLSYHTLLQRLYIWTTSELITRSQRWGEVLGTARYNLEYSDMVVRGGQNVFRYGHALLGGTDPWTAGTALTMQLIAPTNLFTAPSSRHWSHFLDTQDAVIFDNTMAGAGTEDNPRRVARPFTAADEAKLDAVRHEGREEWTAVITNGSSTPNQWGSNAASRGYGMAPPGDTDAAFGSITDNTIGSVTLYALFQNSTNELIMWVHGDQSWNQNFLTVGDNQFHFSAAERLNTTDTGGPESIYTWRNNVPAGLFAGATAAVSVSTPLTDDDYVHGLPDAELEYYGSPRGYQRGQKPTWNSLQVQELAQLVTALPYHPAIGSLRRISGVVEYPDTVEMTVGAATAGASLGNFDDQTIGTLTLQRVSIYARDYTGAESAARAGKVFATFQQVNNNILNAQLFVDGTAHDITNTYASAVADHEHEIAGLGPDDLPAGTYRVQFIQGDDQSPENKSIGRAGSIVTVRYSARDTWVYDGFVPLNERGRVPAAFIPREVLTQAQYTALVAAGNTDPDVEYLIVG